jgi:hypothetical protein
MASWMSQCCPGNPFDLANAAYPQTVTVDEIIRFCDAPRVPHQSGNYELTDSLARLSAPDEAVW